MYYFEFNHYKFLSMIDKNITRLNNHSINMNQAAKSGDNFVKVSRLS